MGMLPAHTAPNTQGRLANPSSGSALPLRSLPLTSWAHGHGRKCNLRLLCPCFKVPSTLADLALPPKL